MLASLHVICCNVPTHAACMGVHELCSLDLKFHPPKKNREFLFSCIIFASLHTPVSSHPNREHEQHLLLQPYNFTHIAI